MREPFIANHDFNFIKKQADQLLHAVRTVADRKVLSSARSGAEASIFDLFPELPDDARERLGSIAKLEKAEDFKRYLDELEPYRTEFPPISKDMILKLFPKSKKLAVPDLAGIDKRLVTYLNWLDVAANRSYIVYPMDGRFVGIEGRMTPTNKKSYCFVCNRFEEIGLFTAVSKKRPANASPDYYKALGQYLCVHGQECNKNITDTASLERFIRELIL
ncbi:FusB/FusC family EF-G-binding protein [Cohnella suwonensis]|uniref:FusB/FusC family EF-G-binding protein n=1 Tax=Cohnella suwonensis TaxID=696072 RepID=A0ABW0LZ63_9BACL